MIGIISQSISIYEANLCSVRCWKSGSVRTPTLGEAPANSLGSCGGGEEEGHLEGNRMLTLGVACPRCGMATVSSEGKEMLRVTHPPSARLAVLVHLEHVCACVCVCVCVDFYLLSQSRIEFYFICIKIPQDHL